MTATATRAPSDAIQRRRGPQLEEAILGAAFAELVESGYVAFSVESVAARARTGKASIYRRWPSKQELVLDALLLNLPTAEECAGAGIVVDDTVTTADALRQIARVIAGVLSSPAGDAMRYVKCEAAVDPELARLIDERFQAPRRAAVLGLLARGVERGEVRPEAVSELVADVIPAVIFHHVILQQRTVSEVELTQIMDVVVIPMIEAR